MYLKYKETGLGLVVSLVLKAATLGLFPKVKILLAEGTDANIRHGRHDHGAPANHWSPRRARGESARCRLKRRNSAVQGLCHGRADQIIDLLLCSGAGIDTPATADSTPLHWEADRTGSHNTVVPLLHHQAAKDVLDSMSHSHLHCAAECCQVTATHTFRVAGGAATVRSDDPIKTS